jgi:hypothetical protein
MADDYPALTPCSNIDIVGPNIYKIMKIKMLVAAEAAAVADVAGNGAPAVVPAQEGVEEPAEEGDNGGVVV